MKASLLRRRPQPVAAVPVQRHPRLHHRRRLPSCPRRVAHAPLEPQLRRHPLRRQPVRDDRSVLDAADDEGARRSTTGSGTRPARSNSSNPDAAPSMPISASTSTVLDELRAATATGGKTLRWFDTDIVDRNGEVVARVRKQLYVRRKPGIASRRIRPKTRLIPTETDTARHHESTNITRCDDHVVSFLQRRRMLPFPRQGAAMSADRIQQRQRIATTGDHRLPLAQGDQPRWHVDRVPGRPDRVVARSRHQGDAAAGTGRRSQPSPLRERSAHDRAPRASQHRQHPRGRPHPRRPALLRDAVSAARPSRPARPEQGRTARGRDRARRCCRRSTTRMGAAWSIATSRPRTCCSTTASACCSPTSASPCARGFGPRVTAAGLAVGSTAYMAPEQARGEDVDGRADLYSLGVLLWEMLTGRLPFEAADALSMAVMHAQDPIPKTAATPAPLAALHEPRAGQAGRRSASRTPHRWPPRSAMCCNASRGPAHSRYFDRLRPARALGDAGRGPRWR